MKFPWQKRSQSAGYVSDDTIPLPPPQPIGILEPHPQVEGNHVANGDLVRDLLTGFEGVITATTTWLHGCDRCNVSPRGLSKDGAPIKDETFDIMRLTLIQKGLLKPLPIDPHFDTLTLGAVARDKMTGFEGVISGRVTGLSGNADVGLEPTKLTPEGNPQKMQFFEFNRVQVVRQQPVPKDPAAPKAKTGGPQRGEDGLLSRIR